MSIPATRELMSRCLQMRDNGSVEDALRHEFSSRLRLIFPDERDIGWVNHFIEGTERHTRISRSGGQANRFMDALVNATAIEFESDLRRRNLWSHGKEQLQEYAFGLLREGMPVSQVRCVLSDTIDWYVFDVELRGREDGSNLQLEDVHLVGVDELRITESDDESAKKLLVFLRKHLAREASRQLTAFNIALDLGLQTPYYSSRKASLTDTVVSARGAFPRARVATDLWSKFVDSLEGGVTEFRVDPYVAETYLVILSRLLCANVLGRNPMLSNNDELTQILRGSYFRTHFNITNIVEDDYFGWLTTTEYIDSIIPLAQEIQHDLYAYDFSVIAARDIFGELMSELATISSRQLLGQEWTPPWLAKKMAVEALARIGDDEHPRFIDMCCGSGAIVIEFINAVRDRYPQLEAEHTLQAITGFDIDPLAVTLAKTNWLIALSDVIASSRIAITIPIYHADSLFAVTPVALGDPLEEGALTRVKIGDEIVDLPKALIRPESQQIFDRITDWIHDEALSATASESCENITLESVASVLQSLEGQYSLSFSDDERHELVDAIFSLAKAICILAARGENGIWAFIIRNTYRPALLSGRFNGLISNPPWLSMSKLAASAYKTKLAERADQYEIKPAGSSHPHLELATTFLVHAVDRYLEDGAEVCCLLPGTITNGDQHEPFRNGRYNAGVRGASFNITDVWSVERGTFKVRALVVLGKKTERQNSGAPIPALVGHLVGHDAFEGIPFQIGRIGTRTAWIFGRSDRSFEFEAREFSAAQGADLMPRTAVCADVGDRDALEVDVVTPGNASEWLFAVKDAKLLRGRVFSGRVSPEFLHRMIQSNNLLPFAFDKKFPPIFLPAKQVAGSWILHNPSQIRQLGFLETASHLKRINHALGDENPLEERINLRNKLTNQSFSDDGYVVLTPAGGTQTVAARLPTSELERCAIDQTLYWTAVNSANEAAFLVGLLNSEAVQEAIDPFVPEGEFGKRHIHTLPYRVIPAFVGNNDLHLRLVHAVEQIENQAARFIADEAQNLGNPNTASLGSRRRRTWALLRQGSDWAAYEDLCRQILLSES